MQDDIVYITFDSDKLGANIMGSTPQNNAVLTGTIEVDYTTGNVSGQYQISGDVTANAQFNAGGSLKQDPGTKQYSFTDGQLTLYFTGQTPSQADDITYQQNQSSALYSTTDEPTPQLTSSDTAPCFVTGTAIATADGPVAVEALAVGDMVLTMSGTVSRVRWIGHRTVVCKGHRHPERVMPIRVSAHAFGADAPARDLYLSPGHAICVDMIGGDVLVPAAALVNGTSVTRHEVETVTYWHVELEQHEILRAENLPCESYLDMGNRGFFVENALVDLGAPPDAALRTHADFCRPFHAGGAVVEAVRCRLAARATAAGRDEVARAAA